MQDGSPKKILWMDLEFTGLDHNKQRIIEVGILVTDFKFNELDKYEAVINQSDQILAAAEDWPKENMQPLFDEVRSSEIQETTVISDICDLIDRNFIDEPVILAGNSIHSDRKFVKAWWPEVDAKLHYRMLDVTSYKVWLQGSDGEPYAKQSSHRALEDIRESINEMKWSLEQLRDK